MQKNDIYILRVIFAVFSMLFVTLLIHIADSGMIEDLPVYLPGRGKEGEYAALSETPLPESTANPGDIRGPLDNLYSVSYIEESYEILINRKIVAINSETYTLEAGDNLVYTLSFDIDAPGLYQYKLTGGSRVTAYSISGDDGTLKIFALVPLVVEVEYSEDHVVISLATIKDRYDKVVYIDAGHGGIDDGAVRLNVKEKEINLKIAKMLYEMVEKGGNGIYPIMSRVTDVNPDKYLRAAHASELADIMISIHCNTFKIESDVTGTETHYNPGQPLDGRSRVSISATEYAEIFQRNVCESAGSKNRGLRERTDLILTNSATIPCILVEAGFISNPGERSLLASEDYQMKIAAGLYNGILEVFGLKK